MPDAAREHDDGDEGAERGDRQNEKRGASMRRRTSAETASLDWPASETATASAAPMTIATAKTQPSRARAAWV